jgi:hypothetical protein
VLERPSEPQNRVAGIRSSLSLIKPETPADDGVIHIRIWRGAGSASGHSRGRRCHDQDAGQSPDQSGKVARTVRERPSAPLRRDKRHLPSERAAEPQLVREIGRALPLGLGHRKIRDRGLPPG